MSSRPSPRAVAVLEGRSTEASGGEMRDVHLLRGLSQVADVQVVSLLPLSDDATDKLSRRLDLPVTSIRQPKQRPWRAAIHYVVDRRLPLRVARFDRRHARAEFAPLADGADIVFFRSPGAFAVLNSVVRAPMMTDIDDVPSELVRQQLATKVHPRAGARAVARPWLAARTLARARFLASEAERWRNVERQLVSLSARVLACSDDDRRLLGARSNTVVVPNGFDAPTTPAGSDIVGSPPTVTLWGLMGYAPNADGARWLVDEVLPHLVALVPDVRVIIAGGGGERLGFDREGVEVLGFVSDLAGVFRRTDVAVVPIRFGGGTRIKIIEAWANQIPVVSTAQGAHGLCTSSGDGALLADSPAKFAMSVHRVLTDPAVRRSLIDTGAVKARSLQWPAIESRVADLTRTLLDESARRLADRAPSRA